MKSVEEQIAFLDKTLLPLYGIQSILDYMSTISSDIMATKLDDLNSISEKLREIFPAKMFNLHKTNFNIVSGNQALNILKMCLKSACVPFIVTKSNAVRLCEKNNILEHYKIQQMEEIRQKQSTQDIVNVDKDKDGDITDEENVETLSIFDPDNDKHIKQRYENEMYMVATPDKFGIMNEQGYTLPNLEYDMYSITMSPVVKPFVDYNEIKKILEEKAVIVTRMYTEEIYREKWKENLNLLPTKGKILPVSSRLYCYQYKLSILEVKPEIMDMIDYFKICIKTVEFRANSLKRLETHKHEIKLPYGDGCILIKQGFGDAVETMKLFSYRDVYKNPKLDISKYGEVVEEKNLKYFRWRTWEEDVSRPGRSSNCSRALWGTSAKFACQTYTKKFIDFVKVLHVLGNGKYSFAFEFSILHDTIANVQIIIPNSKLDLKSTISNSDAIPNIDYDSTYFDLEHQARIRVSCTSQTILRIVTKDFEDMQNIVKNGLVQYDAYSYDSSLRKKLEEESSKSLVVETKKIVL